MGRLVLTASCLSSYFCNMRGVDVGWIRTTAGLRYGATQAGRRLPGRASSGTGRMPRGQQQRRHGQCHLPEQLRKVPSCGGIVRTRPARTSAWSPMAGSCSCRTDRGLTPRQQPRATSTPRPAATGGRVGGHPVTARRPSRRSARTSCAENPSARGRSGLHSDDENTGNAGAKNGRSHSVAA